jgi:transcriptional regulator with XRE-family HTH domain
MTGPDEVPGPEVTASPPASQPRPSMTSDNRQRSAPFHDRGMPAIERVVDRASLATARSIATIGREVRMARLGHGLSQSAVAHGAGLSQSQQSRFERGVGAPPSIDRIARACAVVGLELSLRAYPGGPPLRDAAHVALLGRLRQVASPAFRWSNEVPLPIPGDRRAWDAVGRAGPAGRPMVQVFVEAETRLLDAQAVVRRVTLKKRDAGDVRVILVVRDSRGNRAAAHAARDLIREAFPVPGDVALAALRDGRDPGGDAFLML